MKRPRGGGFGGGQRGGGGGFGGRKPGGFRRGKPGGFRGKPGGFGGKRPGGPDAGRSEGGPGGGGGFSGDKPGGFRGRRPQRFGGGRPGGPGAPEGGGAAEGFGGERGGYRGKRPGSFRRGKPPGFGRRDPEGQGGEGGEWFGAPRAGFRAGKASGYRRSRPGGFGGERQDRGAGGGRGRSGGSGEGRGGFGGGGGRGGPGGRGGFEGRPQLHGGGPSEGSWGGGADQGPSENVRGDGTRFVFGVKPALEALRARPDRIERLYHAEGSMNPSVAGEILSRAKDAQVRVDQVPREKLTALTGGGVHQGVVLEMREFEYSELDEVLKQPGLVVVLDSLQDPQNVGAIIRSANAFGAQAVIMAKDRAAAITGAVVKASAGATEHTRIVRVTNLSRALEELKGAGYWTVAADPEGAPLGTQKLDGPLALVIGSEGPGVRPGVLSHCDFKVRIPMLGQVASLNASVSAGVILYEISRQRAAAPVAPAS